MTGIVQRQDNRFIYVALGKIEGDAYKRSRPYHCTLLAQTEEGLKNLFKLVSISVESIATCHSERKY